MANQIRFKRASGSDPGASDLVLGEPAVRTDTGELFLKKDDNSVAKLSGGGITDGDKGDITVSSSGATFTIDNDVVTTAKMINFPTGTLLGRSSAGTGNATTLTASQVRSLLNVENGATADQSASEILTLLKTVDGAGSGLDADTLDGISSASFVRGDATNNGATEITVNDADFIVEDTTDSTTNFIWRDHSGGKLYLGTATAVVTARSNVNPQSDSTFNLGANGTRWANIYGDQLYGAGSNITGLNASNLGSGTVPQARLSASTLLTLIKTVDGAGSGLDADTLDGATSSFFQNASNLSSGTVPQARLSASTLLTLIKTVDGSGSGLDADSLDGLNSTAFVRSNASDTLTGSTYTFNSSEAEKIILQGASNPYIRFQEGTTDKAYVQWHSDGYLQLANAEDGSRIRIKDDLRFTTDNFSSTNYKIWHAGNDGSGSGLDADLLDGLNAAESGNSARIVRTNASGYIFANYINTTDNTVSSGVSDIMCKTSSGGDYHRSANAAAVRAFINVENGATADQSASEILTLIKTVDGAGSGLDADTLDGVSSGSFLRSDTTDTASGAITFNGDVGFNGGAYAAHIEANSDIAFFSGNWTGNHCKIQHHSNRLYIVGGTDGIRFRESGSDRWIIDGDGNFDPAVDSTYDIGASNQRVRNGYFDTLYGDGSNLTGISAGATGGGSDEVFYENGQTVTTNYTITNGKNAMAAGPITINSGVTVTVGSGETLTIV